MKVKKTTPETAVSKASKKRRLRIGAVSTVLTVFVVAGLILLNVVMSVIAERFPLNIDLTDENLYTLSADSIEIAKGIDKDIEVVVFYDEDLFVNPENYVDLSNGGAEQAVVFREFYKALEQYKTYSGGKLTYSFVDLQVNPNSEYRDYGVQSLSVLFLIRGEDDESIEDDIYRTALITDLYSYEQSMSGSYTYVSRVERIMGSKITSAVKNEQPVVHIITGHKEDDGVVSGLEWLYGANGFVFEEIDLRKEASAFNPEATIAVIAAPEQDFSPEELERLNTWLNNENKLERHLLVFTSTTADCPNLYEFLDVEWGLVVTDELIYETDGNRYLAGTDGYYGFADGVTYDEDSENRDAVFSSDCAGTATLLFPQTRRITHRFPTVSNNGATNPCNIPMVSFPSSAELVSLESADGKDRYKADSYPVYGMVSTYKYGYSNELQSGISTTVTVCGSPYAAYSYFLSYPSAKNEELFLSYGQIAARVDAQMHLSIKQLSSDTLQFTADEAMGIGIWTFTVAVPVLTLLICLVVFIRRRHL